MCDYCALLHPNDAQRLNATTEVGTAVIVTYRFPAQPALDTDASETREAVNEAFRTAAAHLESIIGIRFVELPDDADTMLSIYLGSSRFPSYGDFPFTRTSDLTTGDTRANLVISDQWDSFDVGTAGYESLLQEIGHTLGLTHPEDFDDTLPPALDNRDNTVMSNIAGTEIASTYQSLDIDALRELYDRPFQVRDVQLTWLSFREELQAVGADGRDRIIGGNTSNRIDGKGDRDTLSGRGEDDTIMGGAGNDLMSGLGGDDVLFGGNGFDTMNGGDGQDRLDGNADADLIDGGAGNDLVNGDAGFDTLFGGRGSDTVNGAAGFDIIDGGDGFDTIDGGVGYDTLTGGNGRDTFIIAPGAGNDVITDFSNGHSDRLDIKALGMTPAEALARLDPEGEDMVFQYGSGSVRFEGLATYDFHWWEFLA